MSGKVILIWNCKYAHFPMRTIEMQDLGKERESQREVKLRVRACHSKVKGYDWIRVSHFHSLPRHSQILSGYVVEQTVEWKSILDWLLSIPLIIQKCLRMDLWVRWQALPIWIWPTFCYNSTIVIFHLNWNSIWNGEEDQSTRCPRGWRIRTTPRGCLLGTAVGTPHSFQFLPGHYQTFPVGSIYLQRIASSSSCFGEITNRNTKAYTYSQSSSMPMVFDFQNKIFGGRQAYLK